MTSVVDVRSTGALLTPTYSESGAEGRGKGLGGIIGIPPGKGNGEG